MDLKFILVLLLVLKYSKFNIILLYGKSMQPDLNIIAIALTYSSNINNLNEGDIISLLLFMVNKKRFIFSRIQTT